MYRHVSWFVIAGLFLVVFIGFHSPINKFCAEVVYPFQRTAEWIRGELDTRFAAAWRGLCDGSSRIDQQTEIERLRVTIQEMERVSSENRSLRQILKWQEQMPPQVVAAQVWSHGGGLGVWPRLTLSVGSLQGIAAGDAVIVPEGLVGRIADDVTAHRSEVILLSDPLCRVAAEVPQVARGIVQGARGKNWGESGSEDLLYAAAPLLFRFLDKRSPIHEGQRVITEGSGGVFPKGLTIGTVVEIHSTTAGVVQEALLQPAVDPTLLDVVFVLTRNTKNTGVVDAD